MPISENSKAVIRIGLFLFAVVAVAGSRLIHFPPNFSPLLAVAIFAGAKASNRWFAYLMPVAALMLSDIKLGFHDLMPVVVVSLLLSTFIGARAEVLLQGQTRFRKIFGWGAAGFLASLVFFVITNFAVWVTSSGVDDPLLGNFPKTFEGLVSCFVIALPFFHNQVLSTWIFSAVFLGAYEYAAVIRAEATTR